MGNVVVRYKLWPDRVEENERLVKAVYEQLHRERPKASTTPRSSSPTA